MLILSVLVMLMVKFFLKKEIKTLVYITGGSNEKGGRPECDSGKKNDCDSDKC